MNDFENATVRRLRDRKDVSDFNRRTAKPVSFSPQVTTGNGIDNFAGNALRFGSRKEAEEQVFDLMMRWHSVTDTRVIETTDPVNYTYHDRHLVAV